MKRTSLIAAGLLALLIVAGGLWLFIWRGPGGEELQSLRAVPGDTVVTLSWPASVSASNYFVYRDGNPTPVDYAPITGTTYEDIGLTNGRTYTYTIVPIGSNAIPGNHSEPVSMTPRSK